MATNAKMILVAQAARMGGIWPASPKVRKKLDEKSMPADRNRAMETPPPSPRLLKIMPSGAASRMVIRQIMGWAMR